MAGWKVVGRYEAGAKKYYYKDALGSIRTVVDGSGTVVEARNYDAWGYELAGKSYLSGTAAKEKFTGKERDAESGMDYFGARYYMPALGRFASVDPMAKDYPEWSPYSYALDNPARLVDPTGMAAEDMSGTGPCEQPGLCNGYESLQQIWNAGEQELSEAMKPENVNRFIGEVADKVGLGADGATVLLAIATAVNPELAPATVPAIDALQTTARVAGAVQTGTAAVDEFAYGGESGQTIQVAAGVLVGEGIESAGGKIANGIAREVELPSGIRFQIPALNARLLGIKGVGGRFVPNAFGFRIHAAADATAALSSVGVQKLIEPN